MLCNLYKNDENLSFVYSSTPDIFVVKNFWRQVEHPVTEMISSTDLIEEQIRVALGEKLRYTQVRET